MRGKVFRGLLDNDITSGHNIYVVSATNGVDTSYKIGYSDNISKRLLSYIQANPYTKVEATYHINNGKDFESNLHERFKAEYGFEWYSEDTYQNIKSILQNPNKLYDIDKPKNVKKWRSKPRVSKDRLIEVSIIRSNNMSKYNKVRKSINSATIEDVIDSWNFKANGKITMSGIAGVSGLSLRTIKSRSGEIKEKIKQKNLAYKKSGN